MLSPQVEFLTDRIREAMTKVDTVDAAVDLMIRQQSVMMPTLKTDMASEIEEARALIVKELEGVEILHVHSLIRKRPQWYFGPRPGSRHWPSLKHYLTNIKHWSEENVAGIDEASNEVVSLLENPVGEQFQCRGLVVGYVQSGKTANMTAVIAKAVDAGYNTIIVLAGLTNKLRQQTQLRFEQDLVERRPLEWHVLTPSTESGDFRAPAYGGFLHHTDKTQLAVIKKNVSPLGHLLTAIDHTNSAILSRLRILVVDDECDQATVNSAAGELDMTAINEKIRQLLSVLPAVTYVGYTATPFANVLINPYKPDGVEFDDLYPKDFITALPYPRGYFGTAQLFGRPEVDGDEEGAEVDGLDMIRLVPEDDVALLQPKKAKDREMFQPAMPQSLVTSILYFLAACGARRARGDSLKHMSMLVHTSAYVTAHEKLAALIKGWIDLNGKSLAKRQGEVSHKLEKAWLDEQNKLPAAVTTARPVTIDEIFSHMPDVIKALEVPVENGSSDDRINYYDEPKTYIAVGGSVLARGLTLEGLMVSYFLRTANQYDTLLQMGRWFGYRPNYEDLPRIWMVDDLKIRFRQLAGIEAEIRNDIQEYRKREVTPMDYAVRVRKIPGMAITAAAKMKAAKPSAVSYWGTHRQTTRFDRYDPKTIRGNWAAASELVSRADTLELRDVAVPAHAAGMKIWRGVPRSSITRFLEVYKVHQTQRDLSSGALSSFISSGGEKLERWNVVMFESRSGNASNNPMGNIGTVRMVSRARLKDAPGTAFADIKALMSRGDIGIDCSDPLDSNASWDEMKNARIKDLGDVPLLILYAIDRNSTPALGSELREPLAAADDLLGFGIVFPGSKDNAGTFVNVELSELSADEMQEIEEAELEQTEAAGVA